MLELLWQLLEEAVQRLREVGTLARIYDVRPEDITLQQGRQERTAEGGTGNVRKFCGGLLCWPGLRVHRRGCCELSLLITAGTEGT